MRDRTGKSARIAEKIKKKIGIDIVETKPEVLQANVIENKTEEKYLPKETKVETKKKLNQKLKKKVLKKKNNFFLNAPNTLR